MFKIRKKNSVKEVLGSIPRAHPVQISFCTTHLPTESCDTKPLKPSKPHSTISYKQIKYKKRFWFIETYKTVKNLVFIFKIYLWCRNGEFTKRGT